MKKYSVVLVLVVLLLSSLVLVVAAGGPASKATGSGTWTNGQGLEFYAEFNAHEEMDNRPAKGWLVQTLTENNSESGSFTVDVDDVMVYETYACFGGYTVAASGEYAGELNNYRWTVVVDGGEGLEAMDYLRGSWNLGSPGNPPSFCVSGDTASNEAFSGGNVQIHLGKSYQ